MEGEVRMEGIGRRYDERWREEVGWKVEGGRMECGEKEKSRIGGVKRIYGSWRDLSKKDCLFKVRDLTLKSENA